MFAETGRRLLLIIVVSVVVAGCSGTRPGNLGIRDSLFAPCPPTPNCVSSQSRDSEHAIEPLSFTGTAARSHADLKKILLGMRRSKIITETDSYFHVEFASAIWRFIDDGEFWFDTGAKAIHVRSAARLGSSDLGVNRKRIEEIRARWKALGNGDVTFTP